MDKYTHPQPDPLYLARTYRGWLMGRKRMWMGHGKGHRCLRGLIYYRAYVGQYLAGKRASFSAGGGRDE
jgi:hypothetical protein